MHLPTSEMFNGCERLLSETPRHSLGTTSERLRSAD
jgi:hypothetical protein